MGIAEASYSRRHHRHHHRHTEVHMEMPAPERKWLDVPMVGTILPTATPVIAILNNPIEGTGQSQRIGDQIHTESQQYQFTLSRGTVDSFTRLIWFLWKGDDIPTAAEILQDPTSIVSPLNLDWSKTYRVFKDNIYTSATGQSAIQTYKEFWESRHNTKFTADNVSTITMNGLYCLVMSDQATTTTAPTLNLWHRLRFVDN